MAKSDLSPDRKGQASLTFAEVIKSTQNNFPDARFHPKTYFETEYYTQSPIDTHGYPVATNSDGVGTKPELVERLVEDYQEPRRFESLPFDNFAMIEGDAYRSGHFLVGVNQIVDVNQADPEMIGALALGTKKACDEGRFALLNGETAELGYRTSGYGKTHVNLNATALSIVNPQKIITGREIRPNQPLVAVQEFGVRSNGLTLARKILETAYLHCLDFPSKEKFLVEELRDELITQGAMEDWDNLDTNDTLNTLNDLMRHDYMEQNLVAWHQPYQPIVEELLTPSTLYGRLIYEAQGGVDGKRLINITGAAHITGGGVPEKAKRMLKINGLGADISGVFPDPPAVRSLFHIAQVLPEEVANKLLTEKIASQTWNRGIGYLIATETTDDANRLIELADDLGYKAAIAGKVIDDRKIRFKNLTWRY